MKRFLAATLVFLQVALSFSFNAYEALAQAHQVPGQVQTQSIGNFVPTIPVQPVQFALTQPSILAHNLLVNFSVSVNQPLSKIDVRPMSPAMSGISANVRSVAPTQPKTAAKVKSLATQVQQVLETSAKIKGDSLESSANNKEDAFSNLLSRLSNERSSSFQDSDIVAVQQETLGDLRSKGIQEKTVLQNSEQVQASNPSQTESVVPVPAAQAVQSSKPSFWHKPAVRKAAVLAGALSVAAALAIASPWLVIHFKIVETIASGILAVSAIPQIMRNAKMAKTDSARFKELNIKSPLIWFAAAAYLTVSAVYNNLGLWIAANVAGVVQSSIIIAQINYFKKDAKDLKTTLWTVAAVLAPLPLIAGQVLLPMAVWMNLVGWTWMGLLTILSLPQIRQNAMLYKTTGQAPKAVDPINQALVFGASAMQLFSAIVQKAASYATNATLAMVSTGAVLGQIFFPKATNAVIGPIVQLEEKVHAAVTSHVAQFFAKARAVSSKTAEKPWTLDSVLLQQAKDVISPLFKGRDLQRFVGKDRDARLKEVVDQVAVLPGRSVVFLEAPTSAGKSTLAKEFEKLLGARLKVYQIDRNFKPREEVPKTIAGEPDWDRPEALNRAFTRRQIQALLEGKTVELGNHDMKTGLTTLHSGQTMSLAENEILLVDSTYALDDKFIRAAEGHPTLKIFLSAPTVVRFARRLKRDTNERGTPVELNLKWWPTVLYDEKEFILPMQRRADIVLNLVSEGELQALPDAYADLLAREWAKNGKNDEITRMFVDNIRASLHADETYNP